jgi:outer membrane protein assembly factor BamC
MQYRHISLLAIFIGLSTGCSSVGPEHAIDYAGEQQATRDLAIPPHLTTTPRQPLLAIPDLSTDNQGQPGTITAEPHQTTPTNPPAATQAPEPTSDFNAPHILLPGTQHQVWTQLLNFWQTQGVELIEQNQPLGILRTAWIEDRSQIADDVITRSLSSMLGNLYQSDQRNQYLMRLLPVSNQQTAVFVTHYGTQQTIDYDINNDINQIEWLPRPTDSQHTSDLLGQLATYFAAPAAAQTIQPRNTSIQTHTGELTIADSPTDAWPILSHALHQPMFRIQQQDQNTGRFEVQYPLPPETKTVLASSLTFSVGDVPDTPTDSYHIILQPTGTSGSVILIRDTQGQIVNNTHSTQLISQLAGYFPIRH